ACAADPDFSTAIISSGSALSTLGFSTPHTFIGQLFAIIEGAIGLFIIVYLFTFLPGFMEIIHDRGERVSWIYARTGPSPCGAEMLHWFCRNNRMGDLDALWDDWEIFFRNLAHSRSFLPILCVVRPLTPNQSWVCAFGAFLDALALMISTVDKPSEGSRLCFVCGISAIRNIHKAMRGTPISPTRDPGLMHVTRDEYDAACRLLASAGVPLLADREQSWKHFIEAHMCYEQEIAWLAAAISDPTPFWPSSFVTNPNTKG
ncbi:MAG: potassium channel family protein, partial [Chthoniobacterales bacterium]